MSFFLTSTYSYFIHSVLFVVLLLVWGFWGVGVVVFYFLTLNVSLNPSEIKGISA